MECCRFSKLYGCQTIAVQLSSIYVLCGTLIRLCWNQALWVSCENVLCNKCFQHEDIANRRDCSSKSIIVLKIIRCHYAIWWHSTPHGNLVTAYWALVRLRRIFVWSINKILFLKSVTVKMGFFRHLLFVNKFIVLVYLYNNCPCIRWSLNFIQFLEDLKLVRMEM